MTGSVTIAASISVFEKANDIRGVAGFHPNFDAGHEMTDFSQYRRQEIDQRRRARADAQTPTLAASMRGDGLDGLRHLVGNASRMDQKIAPRRGWLRPTSNPFDQPNAKLLFEQPNVEADGRLRQPGLFGRCGKTPKIRNIDEALQLPEVKIHIKEILMSCIRSIIFILICRWCRLR